MRSLTTFLWKLDTYIFISITHQVYDGVMLRSERGREKDGLKDHRLWSILLVRVGEGERGDEER
jgi:hypothetical protein